MSRQATKIFGIDTIADYLAFCAEAVAELEQDQGSVLRAFAAVLALNHIPDWLQYKLTDDQRTTLGLTGSKLGDPVKDWFEAQNADLTLVRDIANGFKHLRPNHSTDVVAGYGRGPFGVGPFGAPYLLIDLGDYPLANERWVVGLSLCKRTMEWWREQLSILTAGGNHHVAI